MRLPPFTLRAKLICISLLLLTIPVIGFQYAARMRVFLEQGQQEALLLTAQAITSILNNRPDLFDRNILDSLDEGSELHAATLAGPRRLDGNPGDWPDLAAAPFLGREQILESSGPYDPASFKYRHVLGIHGQYLYAFFQVVDDVVVHRDPASSRLDENDYLQIALENPDRQLQRYFLASHTDFEWVNGYLMYHDPLDTLMSNMAVKNEKRIQGTWHDVEGGYNIEIRIPLEMVGRKISFAVADVDDPAARETKTVIGTGGTRQLADLKMLLARSIRLENILGSFENPATKILILDRKMRIRAVQGDFSDGAYSSDFQPPETAAAGSLFPFLRTLFKPVYSFFAVPSAANVNEPQEYLEKINLAIVHQALRGKTGTDYRVLADSKVKILTAATPIRADNEIQGAVVVQQTSNRILAFQNRIIEKTIDVTILVFLVGSMALAIIATTLSNRIRKLSRQAAATIGTDGRLQGIMTPMRARDEIGSLSRTLHTMFEKLQEYTVYQEKLSRNLEHEMRTPLAGISASLKNLQGKITRDDPEMREYIAEVDRNLHRLENILSNVTEATHLEEALKQSEQEVFDLGRAVAAQVRHVYNRIYPDVVFDLAVPGEALPIYGDPNRICQMLDKLIDNAVDFRKPDTPVAISLTKSETEAELRVQNEGPSLEEEMAGQIFNLMVSGRKRQDASPHMGLGLYVVRVITEFHQGRVQAANRSDNVSGARFIIHLPLA
jgi:two-component system sensor histidine kinase ChvG